MKILSKSPITHIFHIADLHIRRGDYHKARIAEYRAVFDGFLVEIAEHEAIKAGTALIIIAGDVFHDKYRIESEGLLLFIDFINRALELAPILVICGNHDYLQDSPEATDLIASVIGAFKGQRVYYLNQTDHYRFGQVGIGLVSIKDTLRTTARSGIVDELPPFPSAAKFGSKITRKIALFHGSISQSALPNECSILGGYPLEWFKGYEFGIFGDNHKQQLHRNDELGLLWGYPGSLIQQDDGEPTFGHGYILWDIAAGTAKCHHIYNPFGSITVRRNKNSALEIRVGHKEVLGADNIMTLAKFPETPKIRYVGAQNDLSEIESWFAAKGIQASSVYSRTVGKSIFPDEEIATPSATADTEHFLDLNQKEKWIEYVLAGAPDTGSSLVKYIEKEEAILLPKEYDVYCADIRDRNKTLQKLLESYRESIEIQKSRRRVILFKNMRWDYLMSYGENNHFDFQRDRGQITLINGPNASGKSGFLDIICLAIFGQQTTTRRMVETGKKETIYVINDRKPYGKKANVSLLVQIDGELYEIYRAFNKNHKQESLVVCYEFKISRAADGIVIAEKTKAADWIADNFGTIADMLMSTILCQTDLDNFFMKPVKKQIELIDSALNMDSITRYQDLLKEGINAHKYVIKSLSDRVAGMSESVVASAPDVDPETLAAPLAAAQEQEKKYSQRANDYLIRIGDVGAVSAFPEQTEEALERTLERLQESIDAFADISEEDQQRAWTFKGRYDAEIQELIANMKKNESAALAFKGDINQEYSRPVKPLLSLENCKERIKAYTAWAKQQPAEWMEDIDSLDSYKESLTDEIAALQEYLRGNMLARPTSIRPEGEWARPKKRPAAPKWPDNQFSAASAPSAQIGEFAHAQDHYTRIIELGINIAGRQPTALSPEEFEAIYKEYGGQEAPPMGDYKKWKREYAEWSAKIAGVDLDRDIRKLIKNARRAAEYTEEHARIQAQIAEIEKELATMADIPYNPDCWACQQNPTHILSKAKRAQLETAQAELARVAKNLRRRDIREALACDCEELEKALEIRVYYENTYDKMSADHAAWERHNTLRALETRLAAHGAYVRAVLDYAEYREEAARREKWRRWEWSRWDEYQSQQTIYDAKTAELKKLELFLQDYESRAAKYEEAQAERTKIDQYAAWESWASTREYRLYKERAQALEREFDANKSLFKRLDELAAAKAQFAKYQKAIYYRRWCAINEELSKIRAEVQDLKQRKFAAEAAAEAYKKHAERTGAYKQAIDALKSRQDSLTQLATLFGGAAGTGYKAYIYTNEVTGLIEGEVNRFLETIDDFRFKISYNAGAFDYHLIDRGNQPNLDNASGYQKFVVGLGMRMALSRIGSVGNNIKHLFIDEGFVSFDANNLEKSADIMRTLMRIGQYESIYIVSHLETIRQMAEAQVTIKRPKDSASILRHGEEYPTRGSVKK